MASSTSSTSTRGLTLPSLTYSSKGFKGLKGFKSIGGFSSGSNSNFGFSAGTAANFGFKPFKAPKTPKGPTVNQVLERLYLQKKNNPHRSLLGSVVHDATHTVETGLDYLSRPSYAVASGVLDATKGKGFNLGQFAHGLKTGIEGKTKVGFGQVLQEHGILKNHNFLRGLAGFGLDVTTDPVLLASLGSGAGEAELAAREAEMGLAKGTLKKAAEQAAKGSFKTSAEAKAAGDLLKQAGDGFEARSGLAYTHASILRKLEAGNIDKAFSKRLTSALHGGEAIARMEELGAGPRMLRAQFKVPFGPMLSKELPIKAPGLQRVADMQGILGKVPGLPKAAETIGKAFKPGWRNEKMHALEIMKTHLSELRQDEMAHLVKANLMPAAEGLSETEMRHALQWGETHPGIVKMRAGRPNRKLNVTSLKKAVTSGDLSPKQADFLAAWHSTTEAIRKADAEYGVKYDRPLLNGAKDNVVYVPHIRVAGTGEKFSRGASVLAKKSFQFPRDNVSQMNLLEKVASEDPELSKQLITNPLEIMARRAQVGATKQADMFMVNTVMSTFGKPTMVADVPRMIRLDGVRSQLTDKLNSLKTLDPTDLAELHKNAMVETEKELQRSLLRAGIHHFAQTAARKREITSLKGQLTEAAKRKVPTSREFLTMSEDNAGKYLKDFAKAPKLAKGIKDARLAHKTLNSLERSTEKSIRDSLTLTPVTGARAHGSNFKRLVGELIDKAPASMQKGLRETYLNAPFKRGDTWEARHDRLIEDVTGQIKHLRGQNQTNLTRVLENHFPTAMKRKNLAAVIAQKQKALDNHVAGWDKIEQRITAKHMVRLQNRVNAINDRIPVEMRIGNQLRKRIDKLDRQIENARIRNPEAFKPGYKVVQNLKHPNGSPVSLPVEMADAITRIHGALNSDEFVREFAGTWQKLVAKWKVGVTVVNPGYRVRNTLSDLWNAYISPHGGVPVWAMGRYGNKAAKLIQTVRHLPEDPKTWTKEQRQASQLFVEMYHHGVLAGLFQGDLEKVRRFLEGTHSSKQLLKEGHPLQALTKTATDFNRHAENWGRMMHYLYRREYQKMAPGEAAQIVRAAHFDYEDLTPAEQAIKRWAVPFYTWTRKNIPYQISAAAMRPGKYAAFPLLANEMNAASPQLPGEITPSWIQQSLGFHVPFGGKGNFYLPVFGPVDLEKVQHPLSQGLSMLSPLIQTPIELAANKSLNTGAPIYGSELSHPRTPISGIAADILKGLPGTNVGTTARTVNGKVVRGPGANPLVSYIASQTPLTNLLVNSESNIKQAQRGGKNKGLLSEFAGLSTYKPDQEAQQAGAQAVEQQAFKQYIKGLRDMGVLPEPKKPKQSRYARQNTNLANQAFGGQ